MSEKTSLAIVGIGCLFPKAEGLEAYWSNIKERVDAIGDVPPSHWRPEDYFDADPKSPDRTYARRGGFLPPVDFDPAEFGLAPSNIPATDPAQVLALVVAQRALRDAGYGPDRAWDRSRASIILGVTGTLELAIPLGARLGHPIWRRALKEAGIEDGRSEAIVRRISDSYVEWQENSFPGLLGNVVAGRIANRLDLGGTNCVVDAACASSLGAAHMAGLELAADRSDVVITGGVDAFNDIFMYMCFSKTPALSPTGDSRPFDVAGDGTILGEGVGMVVLKRLADAERDGDRVYAVLKAVGSSSDGRGKAIYAPSPEGQVKALRSAYSAAGISPETVELVEAHGTGTKVGDAAEVAALAEVYRSARAEGSWCALGSVKSNIGHTKAAAGAAGLIKVALALKHKVLPPTIKVDKPLPELASGETPFYVNAEKRPWLPPAGHPRRAAVSAFGFGGSNFHALLEEHRGRKAEPDWDSATEIVALSEASREALIARTEEWSWDKPWDELRARAWDSRAAFDSRKPFRLAAVLEKGKPRSAAFAAAAKALEEGKDAFSSPDGLFARCGEPAGKFAFLFPGQGSQYVGMLRDLSCQFPELLDALVEADLARAEDGGAGRLSDLIYPPAAFDEAGREAREAALRDTRAAQPALAAVELGSARLLTGRFGLAPSMAAGHSFGELCALWAAGRLAARDLLALSSLRGSLMAEGDGGAMLAAAAPIDELESWLREEGLDLVLANRNSPRQAVLSGRIEEIRRAAEALSRRGVRAVQLPVSAAFHSPLVASAKGPFLDALRKATLAPGRIPVYANSTASPYPEAEDAAKELLAGQLASPVDFAAQVARMHGDGARVFIEVGPGARLSGLAADILSGKPHETVALDASSGKRGGAADLASALAQLAALGADLRLAAWEQEPPRPRKKPALTVPVSGATPINPNRDRPLPEAASPLVPEDSVPPRAFAGGAVGANGAPSLDEALRVSAEGVAALQRLQEQAAKLHEQYLQGQEATQRTLLALVEQQTRLLAGLPAQPLAPPATLPRPALPVPPPEPVPQARSTRGPSAEGIDALLLSVVAEKTGYPVETLNLDMGLESDLGIDSIKRVEILSALRERRPELPAVGPQHLGALRTLRQIIDFLSVGHPSGKANGHVNGYSYPRPALGAADIEPVLLGVVAEKTGYPVETLSLDMGLESDLGIDSIKRVEILSALRERRPELPAVGPQHLGALRTLRQIIDFLAKGSPAAAPAANGSSERANGRFDEDGHAHAAPEAARSALRAAAHDGGSREALRLAPGAEVWISDDGSDLAKSLAATLAAAGLSPRVVALREPRGLAVPEGLGGLVLLSPVFAAKDGVWSQGSEAFVKDAFSLLKLAGPALRREGARGTALLATVSRLDGAFGLRAAAPDMDPVPAALAGLAKTAAKEWPEVRVKSVDLDRGHPDAQALAAELLLAGPEEIGISADGARVPSLAPSPIPLGGVPDLGGGDVTLVTGGARGATAEAALALARACKPTLVLLGRSPEPQEEPDWLKPLASEAEIKAAVARVANGSKPSPRTIEEAARRHLANREILRTLAAVRAAGSRAIYLSCDVRDPLALDRALAAARALGPIRGLLHGAGVLADRLIEEKTLAHFEAVFDTKVAGLRALLGALAGDDLRFIALFSSISGRFGRTGQSDYAAANEALSKAASVLAAARPKARVVAVGWGPLDGGMVTPALRRVFEAEGAGVLPLDAAGRHLVSELALPPGSAAEVLATASPAQPRALAVAFERELDLASHPFLESHRLGGKPVLPLAMSAEWLAHAALHANPGLAFHGFDDLRLLKGVVLTAAAARLSLRAGKARKDGSLFRVPVELWEEGRPAPCARTEALLVDRLPEAPEPSAPPALDPYPRSAERAYAEVIFHGRHFQVIAQVEGVSKAGLAARLSPSPSPADWMRAPLRESWLAEPPALDAAFQAAILWARELRGAPCLPAGLARYRQYRPRFPEDGVRIVLKIARSAESSLWADVDFLDLSGRLVARLEASEHTLVASLAQSFQGPAATR